MRQAYIARYPLDETGDDLREEVIARDSCWSDKLSNLWDSLTAMRKPDEPMLQGWYSDEHSVFCMASTNQPFPLS